MTHVVVMIEKALDGESLTVSEQINEVFGPFTEEQADKWTARMSKIYGSRRAWLITELSDPAVVNKLDSEVN